MSSSHPVRPLIDNLFRREAGKMTAVLTRIFGPHNLELAEDVVQDTLLKALEHWKIQGIPDNPSAWMFTAARNKALDVLRRERHKKEFADHTSSLLRSEYSAAITIDHLLQAHDIQDEQLRMMFVCCHPGIPEEGQVALILKTLCGFSVAEIAKAFLSNEENITKRLYRARQHFRENKVHFELPPVHALEARLENVHTAIYLLFNEGYSATQHEQLIRDDLVEEALRLGNLLIRNPVTRRPESLALLALMCFQAARLYGRVDEHGNLKLLKDQDRTKWNQELILQGQVFLNQSSGGAKISPYHLEAAIAHEHCSAKSYRETNWKKILQFYDWLLQVKADAVVSLNRLIAYAEVYGVKAALPAMEKLQADPALKDYYLLYATLGDWNAQSGNKEVATKLFHIAAALTQTPAEKKFLHGKIAELMI
jgi:RNA polymerase sigma factor (sigma-70 family)